MRLFIDECPSPAPAQELNRSGVQSQHILVTMAVLGEPDHAVLNGCIREASVLVTQNAQDFRARALAGAIDLHPGLILSPPAGRWQSASLLQAVIVHLERLGDPMRVMVDHVAEVDMSGRVRLHPLPR